MTDGYALLRAIEAEPQDDAPRLVYADWLEEQGGEAATARAEFIRVQCRLARLDGCNPLIDRPRATKLLRRFGPAWQSEHGVKLHSCNYQRGFVEPLALGAALFAQRAESLANVTPLHHVRLHKTPLAVDALAACALLAHVRYLDLTSNVLRNYHLAALLQSPHLINLATLNLWGNHIGIAGCEALAAANLPALGELILYSTENRDQGVMALLGAGWMPGLTRLSLGPGWVPCDRSIEALADCPAARGLKRLDLPRARLGVLLRVAGASFPALETLTLYLVGEGMAELVVRLGANPGFGKLQRLDLYGNRGLRDSAARALLDAPHLQQLRRVSLHAVGLSAATHTALHNRFGAGLNTPWSPGDW
jgi:uncharacterized protein (TIGR02996 family)